MALTIRSREEVNDLTIVASGQHAHGRLPIEFPKPVRFPECYNEDFWPGQDAEFMHYSVPPEVRHFYQ